ncbi:MAG: branched-chain amino acid ABC transporter permease [Planctomycetota bacterium]
MTDFLQTLLDGLAIGSLYALIALGYTMVYGILKFINFAHSDIVTLGAWISFVLAKSLGLTNATSEPGLLTGFGILLFAMVFCGGVGFVIERLAYRPLRAAPRLNVLITAIGVSLLLQNTGQLKFAFGSQPQSMPQLLPETEIASFAGVSVQLVDIIGFGTSIALMLGLEWLVFRTKLGRAMRACSFDTRIASLMGIPVDRVISFTFVLGSALAAAGGFLYAMKYPGIKQPAEASWVLLGLKAFVAAVVGGIGNVRGAMLGGFFIGLIEMFGARYVSSSLRDVYVFTLLILVLLLRPSGLLGKATVEKV